MGSPLGRAAGAAFERPQTWLDAGYAAAAVAFVHEIPGQPFDGTILACQALGADRGLVRVGARLGGEVYRSPGGEVHSIDVPSPPLAVSNIDEPGVLGALATLDFSGNEEGRRIHTDYFSGY